MQRPRGRTLEAMPMMKSILASTVILLGTVLTFSGLPESAAAEPAPAGPKDVSAAQVNGTWRCRKNTFKIWALGNGKLQVDFDGVYEYKSPYGLTANLGQGAGIASIEGDTAVFQPKGAEEYGKITLKFAGGKLVAEQEGTCGFGHRVYASGTYVKISGRKPKFGE